MLLLPAPIADWEDDLEQVAEYLREHYQLKVRGVAGREPGDVEEITILNRKLTWKGYEMQYEADPKHADLIVRGVGLDPRPKGLQRPSGKETLEAVDEEMDEVEDLVQQLVEDIEEQFDDEFDDDEENEIAPYDPKKSGFAP